MKKKIFSILIFILTLVLLVGCGPKEYQVDPNDYPKYNTYYQIFVRSFADSDGDGIGDLKGIENKLDYIEEMGFTAIWLTPINPTDSYHGYDVIDYKKINPEYGSMADLESLIKKAKAKGIDVILDMVFNHSSPNHKWHQLASLNEEPYKGYYIYQSGSKKAFESFPGTRDLNLFNKDLKEELKNVLLFYLEKGVAGFRFDAAKHYFVKTGYPEYSTAPDLEAGLFLKELKKAVKDEYPNTFFVGEYFDYNHQFYKDTYLGVDSLFNFEIAKMIRDKFSSGSGEMTNRLAKIYKDLESYNPDYIDTPFVNNHDLNRLATLIASEDARKQAHAILLTLPGSPFIYYGDEIGMVGKLYQEGVNYQYTGKNLAGYGMVYDEYTRLPFIWEEGDSAQTTWFPDVSISNNLTNISKGLEDSNSLANYIKTLANLRKNNPALRFGNSFYPYQTNISLTIAFVRDFVENDYSQTLLIVHNTQSSIYQVTENTIDLFGTKEVNPYGTYIGIINPTERENFIK
ncbi:MAG: hypothetical protein GX794_03770 [Acholeplasmataceae bacterium]|nr:hypothetical protein [Acholeplasmataceae bacterium]